MTRPRETAGWQSVAPFAGAWIEMFNPINVLHWLKSLPSRERGLKCGTTWTRPSWSGSLPSRERGLKYVSGVIGHAVRASLPSRERGLKLVTYPYGSFEGVVAPFAGVWIEMGYHTRQCPALPSLPSRERGLKYFVCWCAYKSGASLPSRERGLKSGRQVCVASAAAGRSLRGSVD